MRLRFDTDAARALADASDEARRCRHAEVTREHVLGALVAVDALWPTVLPLRFHRRELVALIAARLTDLPTNGGYRDATVTVPVSPALAATLHEQQRGLPFFRRLSARDLLDGLLEAPEVGHLVAEARLDLDVLRNNIAEAEEIAAGHQHVAFGPEHVFRVLIEERWFARAIHQGGGDAEVFRARLDAALTSHAVVQKRDEIFPTKPLYALIHQVNAYARMLGRPATSDLFVALALRDAEAFQLVTDTGVEPVTLLSTLLHGVAPTVDAASGDDGPADVVFHSDDFTTQEFVADVLEKHFGLSDLIAPQVTLRVHEKGEAVVGTYPETEARDRARAAIAAARTAGFPLRVEVRTSTDRRTGVRPDG